MAIFMQMISLLSSRFQTGAADSVEPPEPTGLTADTTLTTADTTLITADSF